MMNLENIETIKKLYSEFRKECDRVAHILGDLKFDPKFKDIQLCNFWEIDSEKDEVYGSICYPGEDIDTYSFPSSYLSLSDEDLREIVDEKIRNYKEAIEEKKRRDKLQTEAKIREKEIAELKRLREKYGDNI